MKPFKPIFLFSSSFFPLVVAFLMLLNLGCKKSPTEIDKPPIIITPPSLELSVDDISCTEAWIKVKKLNDTTFLPISIKINDEEFFHGFLANVDTVLFVDSLTPNTTYTVKGIILDTLQTTKELKVTTLPTTSHNFTWQTFTFGERTSALYDVAIIDENNIWAVGEIYMNDSLGNPDPNAYNAMHWNGSKWEIKKISVLYKDNLTVAPLESVFILPTGEIIFSSGLPYLPQADGWKLYHLWDMGVLSQNDGRVTKIWGTSMNDLYFVGSKGTIVHYDGKNWKKIESGTTTDLTDVYGDGDNVFICGYKDFKPTVLLKYYNGVITKLIEEDHFEYKTDFISGWIKSIWVKKDKLFSLTFYDLYRSKTSTKGEGAAIWKGDINSWGSNAVRGNDVNDIFTTGYNGLLWHFNGVSWKKYDELVNTTDPFYSLSVKGNIVVAVGERYLNGIDRYGLIVIGRR